MVEVPKIPPKITIVIACLNAERFLNRCLSSIATQDYPFFELVIVDGASTDSTLEIIRRFAAKLPCKLSWISEPYNGIADAWNKAVKRATGEWVVFIGADDALSAPDVLSRMARHLAGALPDYSVVYGAVTVTGPDGHPKEHLDCPWEPAKFRNCVQNLPHSAVFYHRSVFDRRGLFDPTFRLTLDYDFLLRELMSASPLRVEGLVICDAQVGGISTSYHNYLRTVVERFRLCQRHIGRIPPVVCWWTIKVSGIWLLYQLGGAHLVFLGTNAYRALVTHRPPLVG